MRDEAQQARVDECPACKGTGHAFDIRPDGEPESTGPCPRCYGDGADTCPTCGSGDRFIVRGLCASDTHDPDDWHRAAPSTEVEGEAARGDEEWTIRQTDEWGLEQIAGPDFPGDETVVVPKARADHLQAERDTTDDLYQSIQAQLHAAVRGRGCPEGDICKRCPASEDDDACTPAERLIAERDSLSQQVSQLREALTRVAKFPAQYPDDMGGNGKMAVNSVNQSEIAAAALDGRELRWDCDPAPYENPRTALSDTERNHGD